MYRLILLFALAAIASAESIGSVIGPMCNNKKNSRCLISPGGTYPILFWQASWWSEQLVDNLRAPEQRVELWNDGWRENKKITDLGTVECIQPNQKCLIWLQMPETKSEIFDLYQKPAGYGTEDSPNLYARIVSTHNEADNTDMSIVRNQPSVQIDLDSTCPPGQLFCPCYSDNTCSRGFFCSTQTWMILGTNNTYHGAKRAPQGIRPFCMYGYAELEDFWPLWINIQWREGSEPALLDGKTASTSSSSNSSTALLAAVIALGVVLLVSLACNIALVLRRRGASSDVSNTTRMRSRSAATSNASRRATRTVNPYEQRF